MSKPYYPHNSLGHGNKIVQNLVKIFLATAELVMSSHGNWAEKSLDLLGSKPKAVKEVASQSQSPYPSFNDNFGFVPLF